MYAAPFFVYFQAWTFFGQNSAIDRDIKFITNPLPRTSKCVINKIMKNILITGSCGGMGRATCELLISKGYNVYGLDFNESNLSELHFIKTDVTQAESVSHAFDVISGQVDELDAIIHFAGIYKMNSLVEISEDQFVKMFNVNLFGAYRVNKIFLPLLKTGARIMITSSELAPLDPLPFTGLYAITKTAIEKYAFSLRMELQLLGISVIVIRPGAVKTEMLPTATSELDRFCENTTLYKCNAKRFKRITNSVETRNSSPQRLAKLMLNVLKVNKPRYVYNINRNKYLRLLNTLPQKWQTQLVKHILRDKNNR